MAGHTTKFKYSSMRRMTKRIDALLRQTEYEYCQCGALEKVTDALGQATLHDYDDAGRRTKTTDPDGVWVETGYNRLGQVVSRTNALGKVTQYSYTNQAFQFHRVIPGALPRAVLFRPDGAKAYLFLIAQKKSRRMPAMAEKR